MADTKYVVEFCPMTSEDYRASGGLVISLPVNDILSNLDIPKSEKHKYITATNPYEAIDKTKQIISDLMEENGYLYLDETLTSITFDSEETGEIIRVFNIRLQIIE